MQPALSLSPNSGIPLAKKLVEDAELLAAGLLILSIRGEALFIRYASGHKYEGQWSIPAGKAEEGEDSETAAIREAREETGWVPQNEVRKIYEGEDGESGVYFTTFATVTGNQFIPELSGEHDAWCWAPLDNPPEPLYSGDRRLVDILLEDDLPALDSNIKDQKVAHPSAANIASRSELDSIGLPKTQPKSRAINIAYANGGTTGPLAKQSSKANRYINSGGTVLDAEFSEADHPRDSDGKFGSGGGEGSSHSKAKSYVSDFVKSSQSKQVIASAAKKALGTVKEHHSELLAGAVTFGLYHIAGADFPMDVEAALHHEVEHLATNLGVAKSMVISMMKDAVIGLQGLRKKKGAEDSEEDDGLDNAIANLLKLLEKLGEKYAKDERAVDEPAIKIKRDAFLYLEDPDEPQFAQCGTCWLFDKKFNRCNILPDTFKVNAEDSCGYYLEGVFQLSDSPKVRPEDVGFVKAINVRCENCRYVGDNECKLFELLNLTFPEFFDLDTKISPRGCCNAFQSAE